MNKRTKIIATIGPSTESSENIEKLINAGVNLFRFNSKHNTASWHKEKIKLVREVAKKLDQRVGIILDLQGPDIRIGKVKEDNLSVKQNEIIRIGKSLSLGVDIEIATKYTKNLKKGQKILIDDGKVVLQIESINEDKIILCKVLEGGNLTNKKGVFFPDTKINLPALTKKDKKNILQIAKPKRVEYLALSFVRNKNDVKTIIRFLQKHNVKSKIISKIETLEAVKNITDIIQLSDALMVARGDLGVEAYLEAVPSIQKKLIKRCIKEAKPVIVATQMLKSMIENPSPSRAEISDVANASFESADCVMLSEESAIGKYPTKAVSYMAKTLRYNEMEVVGNGFVQDININSKEKAIVNSANSLVKTLKLAGINVKMFVVLTESGRTARVLSANRPSVPIYAFTQSELVANSLSISWGVTALCRDFLPTLSDTVTYIKKELIKLNLVQKDDTIILTSGQNIGKEGGTDSIRVLQI